MRKRRNPSYAHRLRFLQYRGFRKLLTDREPHLEEEGIDPFGKRWPTADWRLNCINETSRHRFPDAAELLEWMEKNAEELSDDDLDSFNEKLKSMLFEAATSSAVKEHLLKFRKVAKPFKVRVERFFDNKPLDANMKL